MERPCGAGGGGPTGPAAEPLSWPRYAVVTRAEIAAGLFAEVRVHDDRIVSATLARDEYLPLIASATARGQVGVARPEGSEHSLPSIEIEGLDVLIKALRAA